MIGIPRTPDQRLERFRAWLEALTGALETGAMDALGGLFAVECSWQEGPFEPDLRGRVAIRFRLGERFAGLVGLETRAEALGAGATYGIAHWRLEWSGEGGSRRAADGMLLVALDAMGRCSAVREWSVEGPVAGAAGVTAIG